MPLQRIAIGTKRGLYLSITIGCADEIGTHASLKDGLRALNGTEQWSRISNSAADSISYNVTGVCRVRPSAERLYPPRDNGQL